MKTDHIWLHVGDEYELLSFPPDTPCRKSRYDDERIVPLKQAVKEFTGDFQIHLGSVWDCACVSNEQEIEVKFTIRFPIGKAPDKETCKSILLEKINSQDFDLDCKNFMSVIK